MSEPGQAPESAYPVREISARIADTVRGWPRVWVEGQLAELKRRDRMAFLTLRDADADMSIPVATNLSVLDAAGVELGSRVVALLSVEWWTRNGQMQFRAHAMQPVGVGELLLRLEQLRTTLAAEGLFAPERKLPLPALPGLVGLICGRESDAKHDVITNATKRWPHVRFAVEEVAVQGPSAVSQVKAALAKLAEDRAVEVIVIARGGGAFEDLLPFSDEGLLRAVSACRTPVVSAIGHEQDRPLLDDVADVRASTPTDAARRIVPDMAEERAALQQRRQRAHQRVARLLEREMQRIARLRDAVNRAHPAEVLATRLAEVVALRAAADRAVRLRIERRAALLGTARARLSALSPQGTLDRGFAVVRTARGQVILDPAQLDGSPVSVRVARGSFTATPEVDHA